MARCFLYKHKDLSSDLQLPCKEPGTGRHICLTCNKRACRGGQASPSQTCVFHIFLDHAPPCSSSPSKAFFPQNMQNSSPFQYLLYGVSFGQHLKSLVSEDRGGFPIPQLRKLACSHYTSSHHLVPVYNYISIKCLSRFSHPHRALNWNAIFMQQGRHLSCSSLSLTPKLSTQHIRCIKVILVPSRQVKKKSSMFKNKFKIFNMISLTGSNPSILENYFVYQTKVT